MSEKTQYVRNLIDDSINYPSAVIEALTSFKAVHKYNRPDMSFEQATEARFAGMQELLTVLYNAYQVPAVTLMKENITEGGRSAGSTYSYDNRVITMRGKLSVITFLHEFGHALGGDEEAAQKWSINLFKRVYPRSYERLHNPGRHWLTQEDNRIGGAVTDAAFRDRLQNINAFRQSMNMPPIETAALPVPGTPADIPVDASVETLVQEDSVPAEMAAEEVTRPRRRRTRTQS